MFKQVFALIAISLTIILTMTQSQYVIQLMVISHDWVSQMLTEVFSGGKVGNLLRSLLALISLPIMFALIPSLFYWLFRKHWYPYFMHIVWVVWLVQLGALVIMYKAL